MPSDPRSEYCVCYDIREPRRLRRVHRCLRGWGTPLQYIVFHCYLTPRQRKDLVDELSAQIRHAVDDIRIYSIEPQAPVSYIGVPPLPDGLILERLQLVGENEVI